MQPDDIDKLFRGGLEGHRTPPPRDLWERLEDELHPPKKRRAAWWPMAMAAAVALLLVAGGAGLLGSFWWPTGRGELAGKLPDTGQTQQTSRADRKAQVAQAPAGSATSATQALPVTSRGTRTTEAEVAIASRQSAASTAREAAVAAPTTVAPATGLVGTEKPRNRRAAAEKEVLVAAQTFSKKIVPAQATRAARAASTPSNAGLLAQQSASPLSQASVSGSQTANPPAPAPAPALASTSVPKPEPATPADVIEVDVRRGGGPGSRPTLASLASAPTVATAPADEERPRRRLLRGDLGRQLDGVLGKADRVVRTARQGLNALQDLPENLTVQARVGDRTVTKSLEL